MSPCCASPTWSWRPGPPSAPLRPVSHVGFEVAHGEAFGLVGESGSGKSLTLRAVTGLLPEGVRQAGGTLELERDGALRPYRFAEARGRGLGMVFQEPMTALNPTMRVGDLVTAGPRARYGWSRRTAEAVRWTCSPRSACPTRRRRPGCGRTSSPAGSASAS